MTLSRLLEADERASARLRIAERPGRLRTLASITAHSGDSPFWIAGLFIVMVLGNAFWQRQAAIMLIGIFVTAAVVFALKFAFRRQRPRGDWGEVYRKFDAHSFPSGHAARLVMLSALALAFGPPIWTTALIAWAILIMLSRVAMGVHYVSDVAAGAAVGVILSLGLLAVFW